MAPPVEHPSPQPEEPAIRHDHFGFRPWETLWTGVHSNYGLDAIQPYEHILGRWNDPYPFSYGYYDFHDPNSQRKRLAPIDPARQYGGPIFGEQVNGSTVHTQIEVANPVPIDLTQFNAARAAAREMPAQKMADHERAARKKAAQQKTTRMEATRKEVIQLPSPRISPREKDLSEKELPDPDSTAALP